MTLKERIKNSTAISICQGLDLIRVCAESENRMLNDYMQHGNESSRIAWVELEEAVDGLKKTLRKTLAEWNN